MITKSQKVLLMAVKAALFGTKPSYPVDTNWDEVVKEAKAQTVLGIISPVIPVHDESVEQGKATYMRILYEQDKLIKLFDEHNIPCVILKGSAAAIYYPKPYLRAMGDVDILVPRYIFNKAAKLMEENGYIYTFGKEEGGKLVKNSRHFEYVKNGINFELHHHFSSSGFDLDDILENAVSRREYRELSGYTFPVLPDAENGLVLLGHINQHLKNNALGLRQIIDWEMYFNFVMNKRVWKEQFVPLANEAGLLSLAVNVTQMCEINLGLSNRIKWKKRNDTLTSELLNVVLTDGNFGKREISSTTYERNIYKTVTRIKSRGIYTFFKTIGLRKCKLCKKYPIIEPLAFLYGFLQCSYYGLIAVFKVNNVKKQVDEGRHRIELYRKIGIKTKNNIQK